MCAMMPMLRTLERAASAAATVIPTSFSSVSTGGPLPAVVGEGLVGLRHLVRVLAPLYGGTEAIARVEQLVHEALDHRLLAPGPGVVHEPAQSKGGGALRAHLDRDLVGGATDAAALDLQGRLHVVHGPLEGDHGVGAGLLPAALERAVHDALREGTLAAQQDLVDHLRHQRRVVDRVRHQRTPGRGSLAWHYFFSLFAPYRLRACLRLRTPCVSNEPRMIL